MENNVCEFCLRIGHDKDDCWTKQHIIEGENYYQGEDQINVVVGADTEPEGKQVELIAAILRDQDGEPTSKQKDLRGELHGNSAMKINNLIPAPPRKAVGIRTEPQK